MSQSLTAAIDRPIVAVMLPVTSRGCPDLPGAQPLIQVALPSLSQQAEPEVAHCRYYIAYDSDDPKWSDPVWREAALRPARAIEMDLVELPLYGLHGRMAAMWNWIAMAAAQAGARYFLPANDDVHFKTKWISPALAWLQAHGNQGVYAFHDESFVGFPTFHVTSEMHLHYFDGCYYPLPFHGAHLDPWIFDVYRQFDLVHQCGPHEVVVKNRVADAIGGFQPHRYEYGPQTGYRKLVRWGRKLLGQRMRMTGEIGTDKPMLIAE